jgi:hypothetical protein
VAVDAGSCPANMPAMGTSCNKECKCSYGEGRFCLCDSSNTQGWSCFGGPQCVGHEPHSGVDCKSVDLACPDPNGNTCVGVPGENGSCMVVCAEVPAC